MKPKATAATPRLPVDRAFSIKGFGTVVTGTLIAGSLKNGDEIEVLPSGAHTRVRNLQVHGHDTDLALAGQRTAVNLQGISLEQAPRGSVLTLANRLRPTSMLDVRLEVLPEAARPLTHRARVRLHHGTVEVMARVSLIKSLEYSEEGQTPDSRLQTPASIEPGQSDLVQLRLEEPIVALPGDRFIIRSYSPQITIGGGMILDAFPEKHRLRDREVKTALHKLENAKDFIDRAGIIIEMSGTRAMTSGELATRTGATDEQLSEIAKELLAAKRVIEITNSPMMLMPHSAFETLALEVLELLANHHKCEPLSLGISREEVRERLFSSLRTEIFRAVITKLVDEKKIVADRDALRLASHKPALNDADAKVKVALEAAFKAAGLQAVTLDEAAANVKIPVTLARKFYNLLLAEKRIMRVADFVFHADVIEGLKNRIRAYKAKSSRIDVAAFKEISGGLSRKHAIPLLEFLDSERITRRVGNEREIL